MHVVARFFRLLPVLAPVAALVLQATALAEAPRRQVVSMFDNEAPGMTFDPDQAYWGFGPERVEVTVGDTLVFSNPSFNSHPHTVTSLERVGSPFDNRVAVGTRFDSSPTAQTVVPPGHAFTLDTSHLGPGNYTYFCKLHPWMVAEFTIAPRSD